MNTMNPMTPRLVTSLIVMAFTMHFGSTATGQVGKGAILDVNTAVEKDLLTLPT